MKKLLLTLGTAASIAAPLATVVACDKKDEIKFDFIPEEDGFYIFDEFYNGTLHDNVEGEWVANESGYVKLDEGNQWENSVSHIGKGDSIIVAYDNDDTDGLSIDNFTDTIGFMDTSIPFSASFHEYNATFGNLTAPDWSGEPLSSIIKFADGELNHYIGSTFNTGLSLATEVMAMKDVMSEADYAALLEGFFYVEESDGTLSDHPDYDPTGDHAYIRGTYTPEYTSTSMFTYEKISDNAMKITYKLENDEFKLGSSYFGVIDQTANANGTHNISTAGNLHFGNKAWSSITSINANASRL